MNGPRVAGWLCLLAVVLLVLVEARSFGFHITPASLAEFLCDILGFLLTVTGISLALYDGEK